MRSPTCVRAGRQDRGPRSRTSARRGLAVLAAAFALGACDPATMAAGGSVQRARVNVAGQPVTIAAPPGFCVDRDSTRIDSAGAFVLMGDCRLLGGGGSGGVSGAALTAAVSSGGLAGEGDDPAASLEDLLDFIGTPEGLALVSRSQRPGRVRVAATQMRGDVLYVLVDDRGPLPIAGMSRQFWRAFLELNGRMTVLSELGFADPQEGLNQIAALAAATRAANGG